MLICRLVADLEAGLFAPASHIVVDLGLPPHVGYAAEQGSLVLACVLGASSVSELLRSTEER